MKRRTAKQIVDQTNELARKLYEVQGYVVQKGYQFQTAVHPMEVNAWRMACIAQELLTETNPEDALSEVEE